MTKRFILIITILLLFSFHSYFSSLIFAQPPVVHIGIVIDGPWEHNVAIRNMFTQEILTLTAGEFDVRFPEDMEIVADWSLASIRAALDRLLADPEVDFVLAMGVLASSDICQRGDLPKPVIAPFVIDAELQGLSLKEGASGIKNLNYLSLPSHVTRDIKAFREIVSFNKVTILVNKIISEAIPELYSRTRAALQEMSVETQFVLVEETIDSALNKLTEDVEAVYVGSLLHLPLGDFERLVNTLIERKIPSFSLLGISEVERGLMAAVSPNIFPKTARRVALNVQRILLGESAENLPVAFAFGERLTINMTTARSIGVSPPFAVLTEAELLNEQRQEIERRLYLAAVLEEAIARNLDLAAEGRFVLAGQQNINEARSNLLPQINVSGLGLIIDRDRAEASFGSQAQRSLSGSATISQLIFSEPALANVSIQRSLQDIRTNERERLRLNIAQAAATAYLNVLRGKTFERVQKENLKRTRSNLELARIREAIGQSGRSEVFRWEREIAIRRKEVIAANALRNLAEIELNRLLHRPLEEPFLMQEIDLSDPALFTSREGVLEYFSDRNSFRTFRTFMVTEGLAGSPEIRALDAAISAKEREFRSASRSFWSPAIAVQAQISNLFKEGGAGTISPLSDLPPEVSDLFPPIQEADNTSLNVGLNFSIPIFEGGARFAKRSRASEELQQFQTERTAIAERIEQRVRSALHVSGASHAAIALSQAAAVASNKNLDLVTDAYSRGAVNILDLLDAQNAALLSELDAENAVHDFLIDLFEVERSVGYFYFLLSDEERQACLERLNEFFEKAGVR